MKLKDCTCFHALFQPEDKKCQRSSWQVPVPVVDNDIQGTHRSHLPLKMLCPTFQNFESEDSQMDVSHKKVVSQLSVMCPGRTGHNKKSALNGFVTVVSNLSSLLAAIGNSEL